MEAARRLLEDVLDREIEAARSLAAALSAERSALTGDSPSQVERTAAEKIELLAQLEQLEQQRRALCASPPDSQGLGVADRWRALMAVTSACRAANEINGYIIHVRQNQVRQLMDIVRGATPVTYGPQGKTFPRALRALAKA